MKSYACLVIALLAPISSLASEENCSETQATAEKIMSSRQNGIDAETLKRALLSSSEVSGREKATELADKALELLNKAYATPMEGMLSRKYLASREFSRASFLNCVGNKPLFKPKNAIADTDTIRRITGIENKPKTTVL